MNGSMSMGSALTWQAARDPDRPALTMGERTYTRGELDRAANRIAPRPRRRGASATTTGSPSCCPTGRGTRSRVSRLEARCARSIPLPAKIADEELNHLVEQADAEARRRRRPGSGP